MITSSASREQARASARSRWNSNSKRDLWVAFWTVPVFFTIFGIVFIPLSWMMPPRSPGSTPSQIDAFMHSDSLLLACAILTLTFGLGPVSNAVYLTRIERMSVSPAFRYTLMGGAIAGTIVGMLFPLFCFALGAFRPGYRHEVLAMLFDFGYLAFIGSLGCFCIMWMAFGLAILLDENGVLPKWLGYYTVWQYVSELVAAPVWIAKSGPFAWNGILTFWLAMALYVSWQIIVYICIFQSIKRQSPVEWRPDEGPAPREGQPEATA